MTSQDKSSAQEAQLHYGQGEFVVLRSGRFVTCAATGQRIPLDTLRYWSSERQEPYAGAAEATRVLGGRAV